MTKRERAMMVALIDRMGGEVRLSEAEIARAEARLAVHVGSEKYNDVILYTRAQEKGFWGMVERILT